MSFGEDESCVDPTLLAEYHAVFVAATQKNITLFASSGDQGVLLPSCDGTSWSKSVSSPASDPLVTAVGGTELHATGYPANCTDNTLPGCSPSSLNPMPGTYQGEIVWNEGPPFGDFQDQFDATEATGGGFSVLFDQPPWQKSALPNGMGRGVPDVAYSAAILHGILIQFLVGHGGGTFLFGGTSCGSPQWSALTAITNQKAGYRLGFLNKAIYHIGKVNKLYPASFHDTVSGNNSSGEFDSMGNLVIATGFTAGNGWDPTTGLGSPIEDSIADDLIKNVHPGDGTSAIASTKPKHNGKSNPHGHVNPH
jgi:subtilase family serine protease